MFEVTDAAVKEIANYFKKQDPVPIRIFLNTGGWAGASLAMALDESKDTDEKFEIENVTYVVDKNFFKEAKPIKIDYSSMGFKIDSNINLKPNSSECSSCSSCN